MAERIVNALICFRKDQFRIILEKKITALEKVEILRTIEPFSKSEIFEKKKSFNTQKSEGYDDDYYEEGPYCRACQESPCMCSDPYKTSTTLRD